MDFITVNHSSPPKRCQTIREPTKIPERIKAAIFSFCSQGSTFRLCKMKTPTVRPIRAPKPWPALETLLQFGLLISSLSQRITCKQDEIKKKTFCPANLAVFLLCQIWIVKYSVKYSTVDCKYLLFLQDFFL